MPSYTMPCESIFFHGGGMILGIRCSNSDYSFALLKGSKGCPEVANVKSASYPKGYSRPEILRWLYQEIEDYSSKNIGIETFLVKGAEPMAQKGGAYTERVECEAIMFLVAAQHGLTANRKVKQTIAKDLGLAGRAKALEENLDTSVITDFENYSTKEAEAILVAWSGLKL